MVSGRTGGASEEGSPDTSTVPEVVAFSAYFRGIQDYEYSVRCDDPIDRPAPPPFGDEDSMDIDPVQSSTQLSNSTLQATSLSIEAERTQRRINNVSPRVNEKRGRALNSLTARVIIERSPKIYCVSCLKESSNKATDRVYKHAVSCHTFAREFPKELQEVKDALANKSTPVILENNGQGAPRVRTQVRNISDPYVRRTPVPGISPSGSGASTPALSASGSNSGLATSAGTLGSASNVSPAPTQTTLEGNWGASKLTVIRQATIDYFLLRMIICCALAFSLLDNGFFVDFCIAMCPGYLVPDRSSFFNKHIAAEATHVLNLLKVFLAQFIHLTLSFDGWSSKAGDEIYTVHVTTPSRMSFLVDGLVMTGMSTSAENLFNRLLAVLALYVAISFSLVVSDTTGNVKKCRALICQKFPWILNCPDPCHQLNLLAKDLVLGSKRHPKIKAFATAMTIVNGLTNYFSHSNYGKHHLKEAMKSEKDKRGIQVGGATRFSTFATHASSVLRCLPFMEKCYTAETITFDTKGTRHLRKYVQSGSDENGTFRTQLNQIGRLLNPIARALKTLEGQQTTCSDVFFIYIGLAVAFQRAFSDPDESFYIAHQQESYAAFDRRFKGFTDDCTPGMFLLAYFLDPIYYSDNALKLNLPPRARFSKETAPVLARTLIRHARQMLSAEQLRERQGGPDEGELLVKQLIAYMYREAPFNDPCSEPLFRLAWWKARVNNPDANQLAKLGIKLFSVSPSEMCDERTASKMTAQSTAKRNGLASDNIINTGILEQYWKYGFTSSNVYTHTARLVLDDFNTDTAPPTRTLPAPTLQDLLNPVPVEVDSSEATLFNNADPYGSAALSDDEDDDEEESTMASSSAPTRPAIIRSSAAPRLAIEEYINLEAAGLVARLDPGNQKKASGSGSSGGSTVPVAQKPKWTPESTAWGEDNGGW